MPQIGTFLLANVFSALLPPVDPEERDFYEILGVDLKQSSSSSGSQEQDIRKAYKVKSLKLHPDKVAQRGNANKEEAAAEYELVQEAYSVLVNEEKRATYHALHCSPTRYRFVAQGALANPGALYENLTGASFLDKTRLVVLCTVLVLVVLLQPILIATKLNHLLEANQGGALEETLWTVILVPFWILGGLVLLFWVALLGLAPPAARWSVGLTVLEHLSWYVGAIVLALKWDGSWVIPYHQAMVPVYIAMALRWMQSMVLLQKVRQDVHRMVTVDYLDKEVLKGKSLEDLSEEERKLLQDAFLVVTVPADFEPYYVEEGEELDDKALEEQKVEASPEYESATKIYNSTFGGLVGSLVFGITFLIVLTLRLDRKIDANWWTVFTPIWIYLGSQWVYYCYGCMCGTVMGEEIILQMHQQQDQEEGDEEKDKENDGKNEKEERPTDELFVDLEASITKFNNSEKGKASTDESGLDGEATTDENRPGGEVLQADQQEEKLEVAKEAVEKDTTTEETKQTAAEEEKSVDKTDSAKSDDDKKGEGEDDDPIGIDQDTFHAWQNAYEEAERGAMEQQAKSSMECCNLSVQIMLLCLVVAKIEAGYPYDDEDPTDVGFNTFWIIFPFFLFFGVVICCCACLIYGAAPGDPADLYGGSPAPEGETNVENPSASADVLVMEPPSMDESAAETTTDASTAGVGTTEASAAGVSAADSTTLGSLGTTTVADDSVSTMLHQDASTSIADETQESENPNSIEDLD
jgi:hypothetical protein